MDAFKHAGPRRTKQLNNASQLHSTFYDHERMLLMQAIKDDIYNIQSSMEVSHVCTTSHNTRPTLLFRLWYVCTALVTQAMLNISVRAAQALLQPSKMQGSCLCQTKPV